MPREVVAQRASEIVNAAVCAIAALEARAQRPPRRETARVLIGRIRRGRNRRLRNTRGTKNKKREKKSHAHNAHRANDFDTSNLSLNEHQVFSPSRFSPVLHFPCPVPPSTAKAGRLMFAWPRFVLGTEVGVFYLDSSLRR